jgi:hypothetical protein
MKMDELQQKPVEGGVRGDEMYRMLIDLILKKKYSES